MHAGLADVSGVTVTWFDFVRSISLTELFHVP